MRRWSCVLVLGSQLSLVGCAAFTLPFTDIPADRGQEKPLGETSGLSISANRQPSERELPPEKAAKLCLAAADEMEKAGELDQAISQCELARQHNSRQPGVSRKLAGLYARQGQYAKAIDEYNKELAKSPRDADLLNDIGYCHYEQKNYEMAEKHLRQALALKPNLQRAQANLGLALGREEKWKESLEAFKKAGSLGAAHANLAAMYHAAGQDDNALRECKIALGLEPQLKAARELLTAVENLPGDAARPRVIQASAVVPKLTEATANESPSDVDPSSAIRLSKPVLKKSAEEPTFRPLK
jgi:tetratricopeptide (TPR) repeat protein